MVAKIAGPATKPTAVLASTYSSMTLTVPAISLDESLAVVSPSTSSDGSPTAVPSSMISSRLRCCYCDNIFVYSQGARKYEITTSVKGPSCAMQRCVKCKRLFKRGGKREILRENGRRGTGMIENEQLRAPSQTPMRSIPLPAVFRTAITMDPVPTQVAFGFRSDALRSRQTRITELTMTRPTAMLIVHKELEYTTCIQVDAKQGFQKCSFYREQPIHALIGVVSRASSISASLTQSEWRVKLFVRLSTQSSREPMRKKQSEYEVDPECKGGGKRETPSKPADLRHRLARFLHAEIRGRHSWESDLVRLAAAGAGAAPHVVRQLPLFACRRVQRPPGGRVGGGSIPAHLAAFTRALVPLPSSERALRSRPFRRNCDRSPPYSIPIASFSPHSVSTAFLLPVFIVLRLRFCWQYRPAGCYGSRTTTKAVERRRDSLLAAIMSLQIICNGTVQWKFVYHRTNNSRVVADSFWLWEGKDIGRWDIRGKERDLTRSRVNQSVYSECPTDTAWNKLVACPFYLISYTRLWEQALYLIGCCRLASRPVACGEGSAVVIGSCCVRRLCTALSKHLPTLQQFTTRHWSRLTGADWRTVFQHVAGQRHHFASVRGCSSRYKQLFYHNSFSHAQLYYSNTKEKNRPVADFIGKQDRPTLYIIATSQSADLTENHQRINEVAQTQKLIVDAYIHYEPYRASEYRVDFNTINTQRSLSVAIGSCLLEKQFSYLTRPLRIPKHQHVSYEIRVQTVNTLYLGIFSAFEAEKRGTDKDEIATHIKYPIAAKRKAPNWRAVFQSHCAAGQMVDGGKNFIPSYPYPINLKIWQVKGLCSHIVEVCWARRALCCRKLADNGAAEPH
ncbi:hypothetical protein PR048_030089 [Dryococelus australis]|uniref:Uncharacterized protein n=1 Tax=Dryococelus australis TaxID=614101 RepID=A0ABQ9G7Z1_9NEOP|nr:hypothetical protein PR048_030089 [Dryococelus australis]